MADELERALDTLAAVVRATGRFALDTAERPAHLVHDLAEHWSQHLLIRRPKPGDEERSAHVQRDYRALLEFVTEQRRQESTHAQKVLSDLRQTVWAFIRSLSSAFTQDAKGDELVTQQLRQLQDAAQHGSLEELRRAAMSTAGSIAQVMEQRRTEQRARNGQLGDTLSGLGRNLIEPRAADDVDTVTLLNLRPVFDEYAGQLVELRPFLDQPSALVLIELSEFTQLAARHGAAGMDDVLRAFSGCLVRTFLRKDDFLARFDEHQFAIVLPDTDFKHALVLADRLPAALRRLEIPGQPELTLSVVLGVSTLEPADTVATWIERAVHALDLAKRKRAERAVPA